MKRLHEELQPKRGKNNGGIFLAKGNWVKGLTGMVFFSTTLTETRKKNWEGWKNIAPARSESSSAGKKASTWK